MIPMKKHLILIGAILLLLFECCEKSTYNYLDKNTLYVFELHDTLIYKSVISSDTFLVKLKKYSFYNSDKTSNSEELEVILQPLLNIASIDNIYDDNYFSISIYRRARETTQIYYGSSIWSFSDNDSVISYTIGSHIIPNIYKKEANIALQDSSKFVKTIFYNHNYGIIAYILSNDVTFELDERYFK
jgi:hypothetical protein